MREQFSDEPTGISDSVARMLNIDASKQRMKAVRAAIGRKIEFEPAPRSDLDVLFLAAFELGAATQPAHREADDS